MINVEVLVVGVDGRDVVSIVSVREEDGGENVDCGRSELAVGAQFGREFESGQNVNDNIASCIYCVKNFPSSRSGVW